MAKKIGVTQSEINVSKALEDQPASSTVPRLYIQGRSTLEGRLATTLRVRPSLIKELETVAIGPLYLLVDVAIQDLVAKLKSMPAGNGPRVIDAVTMDPSVYDRSLLEEADRVPKKRAEYLHAAKAKKAVADEHGSRSAE